jgi:putative heme-binding domain-containing protein
LKPEIVARLNPASQSFASLARLVLGSKDENLTARFIEAAAATGDKVRLDQLQRLRGMLDAMAGSGLPLDALRRSAATPALNRQLAAIDASLVRIEAGISDAGHVIDPGLDGAAVSVLSMDVSRTGRMLQLARRWLDPSAGIEAQRLAMKVIGATRPADAVETLTADWASRTPQARQEIINLLLSHGAWTRGLLALVKGGAVAAGAFDAQQRASLLQHPSKAIAAQAAALLATAGTPTRAAVMEKFKTALSLAGDAARGKQVFTVTGCIACHQLDGTGLPVGPDLRSVVSHVPEKLLSSILDPSAVIEPGFTAYHGTLKSGEQLYGIVATETSGSITMRLPGNVLRSVLRSEIDGLKSTQSSLMPDGLEALFTPQSLADLIAYLKVPK